jgi:predicted unusual protein kinase regulating ubiquinone biosynthesis (AarF/ABC1/UbiB family)
VLRRAWHTIARTILVSLVLFPMWLAYVVPWLRARRGAKIPAEVWKRKHERYAARFYWLATRMRGGLIKVGQILSTRVDLLPVEWTQQLSGLQDKVTPTPWSEIEGHLLRAYRGRALADIFEHVEHDAVAAASFGQVHRARTKDGTLVALKIKYPDVELKLSIDLFLFGIAVRLFNVFLPKIELFPIYGEMKRALSTELDYEQEARFTRIVYRNFSKNDRVFIPRVIDELTTRDVICTTFFEGKKIIDPELLAGVDREKLLELVLSTWIQMMYVDGVFQSDPHPGNLLVRIEDGAPLLCVVDFGQVKILSQDFHQKLVASVMAFSLGNVEMFVSSLSALGLFPESESDRVRPILEEVMERIRGAAPLGQLDFGKLRTEVKDALDRIEGIAVPQEIVLYGRTFALLAGLTRAIAPEVNALEIARPLITRALLAGGPPARPIEEAAPGSG